MVKLALIRRESASLSNSSSVIDEAKAKSVWHRQSPLTALRKSICKERRAVPRSDGLPNY
jgi:hypothetical protein